jgi:hypothetical protein
VDTKEEIRGELRMRWPWRKRRRRMVRDMGGARKNNCLVHDSNKQA